MREKYFQGTMLLLAKKYKHGRMKENVWKNILRTCMMQHYAQSYLGRNWVTIDVDLAISTSDFCY